jgi:hypothetical protein
MSNGGEKLLNKHEPSKTTQDNVFDDSEVAFTPANVTRVLSQVWICAARKFWTKSAAEEEELRWNAPNFSLSEDGICPSQMTDEMYEFYRLAWGNAIRHYRGSEKAEEEVAKADIVRNKNQNRLDL